VRPSVQRWSRGIRTRGLIGRRLQHIHASSGSSHTQTDMHSIPPRLFLLYTRYYTAVFSPPFYIYSTVLYCTVPEYSLTHSPTHTHTYRRYTHLASNLPFRHGRLERFPAWEHPRSRPIYSYHPFPAPHRYRYRPPHIQFRHRTGARLQILPIQLPPSRVIHGIRPARPRPRSHCPQFGRRRRQRV